MFIESYCVMELQQFTLTEQFDYILCADLCEHHRELKVIIKCGQKKSLGVSPSVFNQLLCSKHVIYDYLRNVTYKGEVKFLLCSDLAHNVKIEYIFRCDVHGSIFKSENTSFILSFTDTQTKEYARFDITTDILTSLERRKPDFNRSVIHWMYAINVTEPNTIQDILEYYQMETSVNEPLL